MVLESETDVISETLFLNHDLKAKLITIKLYDVHRNKVCMNLHVYTIYSYTCTQSARIDYFIEKTRDKPSTDDLSFLL
jgi:hypothetical protein